jgi:two-component system NtrC family sensor kinase
MTRRPDEARGERESGAWDTPELDRPSRVAPRPSSLNDTGKRTRFEMQVARRAAAALEGTFDPPGTDEILAVVLELNRTLGVELQEEAIVHGYIEALRGLFPRRRFAVRMLSSGAQELALVYATGRLAEARRETLVISEPALARHELSQDDVERAGAKVAAEYEPIFDEPGTGFDIPLSYGGELTGMLSVEYDPGLSEPSFDRSMIVPVAVQLGAALRNARLFREANYLRENLEKLLDHANAPIVVIGKDRELRVVNRAFLSLTGVDRQHLLGRDFLTLLPETERGRILPVFIRALRGDPTNNFELRLPRPGGGYSRLVINTASILATDGEIEGVIAIGRDLTEVRELEEQIIQAEKLATLGQLAAGVVHELNNPLTSISVYGEYLVKRGERSGQDQGDLEKLRRIVESASRIQKFARDLVTYARPSTEEPAFVPIQAVIEQSLAFCEHVVKDAGATIERRFHDEEAHVYAVRGQLHQVFINLVTNACHALEKGRGVIVIRTESDAEDFLHVAVEDNGCGIPRGVAEKIFEPFFSTKAEGKGTGLGLSIVRNIVQQHGGTIEVKQRDAGGTIFEIKLPGRSGS